MNYIATRLPMLDGREKVSGTLRYLTDLKIAGTVHGKLVLSPHPHARVISVDATAALAMPGVLSVFWHGNTPQHRYNSSIWFEGQEAIEDEQMFPPVVRHVGDRIAAVVAETAEIAEEAARLVTVHCEALPAEFDAEAALAAAIPEDAPDRPLFSNPIEGKLFCHGDPEQGFASADVIVEARVTTPKTHHAAIEPHACLALPQDDGRVLIYSPCQSIFAVQVVVAKALGVAAKDVRVIKTAIGGSFGGKAEPILDPLCACFAKALQRPVLIALDRRETCLATRMRSRVIGQQRMALSREGKILARDTTTLADVGAYSTGGNYLPGSMLQRLVRLYDVPAENYRGHAVYTNTPPTGAFRGYGSPQINAIAEITLDRAARALAIDPLALRLRNIVKPFAIEPYQGLDVGNAGIRACLVLGARRFAWHKRRRTAEQSRGRFKRGVGLACSAHVNGCYPGSDEYSTVSMSLRDEGRIAVSCALHDLGCGGNTTLTQIAAEVLSQAPEHFDITPSDTDLTQYDIGTRASRMTYILGEAFRRAAEQLKEAVLLAAARFFNCAPSDLALADGEIRRLSVPVRVMKLAEFTQLLSARGEALPAITHTYSAVANPSSYAAHFAEVEVDCLTGRVRVRDYLAAHDVGRAINPMLVEGQIHGGIQAGIGYALFEDVNIDPVTGVMKADRFSRYHLVNAPEMPPVEVLLVEPGEPTGPFGAKAVGEIATIPVAPAIVNAVNHALGTALADLPLTPERIVAALG